MSLNKTAGLNEQTSITRNQTPFFFPKGKKNKILWSSRRSEPMSQRLHCFSSGEMGQAVSQFSSWTNEIFGGLFNFTANVLTKKDGGKKKKPHCHHWD